LEHWALDAVFYHVYPLGLCGAPRRNDFAAAPVDRLEALHGWIGHVRSLGANALYLGPLFESSGHGYDTADYWHVDRRLGTDATLVRLVEACHSAGIRVVLDGVFNHVGRDFWAFRDVRERGADSAYTGWFAGIDFSRRSPFGDPFTYEPWAGHYDLVKLSLSNADVRAHLLGAVHSWIVDFGIDGIRLDAADVVDLDFQRELAAWCRSLRPDFFLLGEVVHGDYRRWANPATLDSVTNYEAYKGLWSSLADRNYFEIAYTLRREFGRGGLYDGLALYNFVDNHDQDRVAARLPAPRLLGPLHLLLFTMPGIPSIYYGSEWGLAERRLPGDDGPVRPALEPGSGPERGLAPGLAEVIARLAAVRAACPALRRGTYRELLVAPEQLAFAREIEDGAADGPGPWSGGTAIVVLNAAEGPAQVTVPCPVDGEWRDLLGGGVVHGAGGRLHVEVPPSWGRILVR
jgi:cyclomaltodextrinase / maltogenic alpha-amylase / neopullulanase